jgi:hypothetical protein
MSQLPADCLNEIFEYLKHVKHGSVTLYSCLLVNRLWCEVAVRLLWKEASDYNITNVITLIACLPNESKEILHNNGIIIPTPTLNLPMFNYASFCKNLSIYLINTKIRCLLENQPSISAHDLSNKIFIVVQEIFKLFMNQISSLKCLCICSYGITLTIYPGAKDCLKNLSELICDSNTNSELIYQLSQICHNLSSIRTECIMILFQMGLEI